MRVVPHIAFRFRGSKFINDSQYTLGNGMTPDEERRFELYAKTARDRRLFFNGRQIPYKTALTPFAKQLRASQTECELRVGGFLKTFPYKIRPQHPIDGYIVDFFIPALHLVIEVDGEQHSTSEGKAYDQNRDTVLRMYELEILRIPNSMIRIDFSAVCDAIRSQINAVEALRK